MKAAELRELTTEELVDRQDEAGREQFELRVRRAGAEESVQPLKARALRREIARIKTVMRERQDVTNHG